MGPDGHTAYAPLRHTIVPLHDVVCPCGVRQGVPLGLAGASSRGTPSCRQAAWSCQYRTRRSRRRGASRSRWPCSVRSFMLILNHSCNSTVMLIIPSASARRCTHDAPAACRMAHGTASHSVVLGCAVNAARVAFVTAGAGKAEMVQVTPAV
jgi:hypothetical protein